MIGPKSENPHHPNLHRDESRFLRAPSYIHLHKHMGGRHLAYYRGWLKAGASVTARDREEC